MRSSLKFSTTLLVLFAHLLFSTQRIAAQPNSVQKNDIEAKRIGFITKELQLTSQEAEVFWPVYNRYHDELEILRKGRGTELMAARVNFDKYSDDDINKIITSEFDYRQKELDLQKKYDAEFKKVLPVKKVAKLYRAEQLFKIYLIKEGQQQKPPAQQSSPHN